MNNGPKVPSTGLNYPGGLPYIKDGPGACRLFKAESGFGTCIHTYIHTYFIWCLIHSTSTIQSK